MARCSIGDGKPVALLESLSIERGGQVNLRRFRLLGAASTAGGVESLLRLLGAAAAIADRGVNGGAALDIASRTGDLRPRIVEGMTQQQIEAALSAAVHTLVLENAEAIPGVNLPQVLGIGP